MMPRTPSAHTRSKAALSGRRSFMSFRQGRIFSMTPAASARAPQFSQMRPVVIHSGDYPIEMPGQFNCLWAVSTNPWPSETGSVLFSSRHRLQGQGEATTDRASRKRTLSVLVGPGAMLPSLEPTVGANPVRTRVPLSGPISHLLICGTGTHREAGDARL